MSQAAAGTVWTNAFCLLLNLGRSSDVLIGFKVPPVLGEYVVDVLEGKSNEYTQLWKWRIPSAEDITRIQTNITPDERNWHKQPLASAENLKW